MHEGSSLSRWIVTFKAQTTLQNCHNSDCTMSSSRYCKQLTEHLPESSMVMCYTYWLSLSMNVSVRNSLNTTVPMKL